MSREEGMKILAGKEQARRVFDVLSTGIKKSVVDLTLQLRIADPRAVIRQIRDAGISVQDEWCKSNGKKYKRYWVQMA